MRRVPRQFFFQYGIMIALLATAFFIRWAVDPVLGDRHGITLFLVPVVLTAWWAGIVPAIFAAIGGWMLAEWFFIQPRQALIVDEFADLVGVTVYLFVGIAVAVISGAMRRAQNRAEKYAAELTNYNNRLENLVTERTRDLQRTYEQMHINERMAVIGTFAAGLSHDLGNLLLPMRARLERLSQLAPDNVKPDVESLRSTAEYLQRLAGGLRGLMLDPNKVDSNASLDVHEWWDQINPLMRTVVPSGITLKADFAADTPSVQISQHLFTQAIFNLVQNAGKAMIGMNDGSIAIWSRRGDNENALVGVSDTGPGMSDEIRKHCTDAFFSSGGKHERESLGLGLTLVRGIVDKTGGSMQLESELGRGTTFVITLPASAHAHSIKRRKATVSIDDSRTKSWISALLQTQGYDTNPCETPIENDVELWVAESQFVVTDVARRFVESSESRHLVVIGREQPLGHGRVHYLDSASPREFTQTLKNIHLAKNRLAIKISTTPYQSQTDT